ncbi:hypothetical protein KHP60_02335 [Microvirga sp. 3-52]|uniref:hypothetical protein n=1 Tax=Microvirga sp. 3-52 TaxID=2792425 RepID=UPI001BCBC3C1|nr:hypothetical protein [Microvirga sp. 3-52]MBS7451182.1 hypothetical protein [Microvirga sp. 3-52]
MTMVPLVLRIAERSVPMIVPVFTMVQTCPDTCRPDLTPVIDPELTIRPSPTDNTPWSTVPTKLPSLYSLLPKLPFPPISTAMDPLISPLFLRVFPLEPWNTAVLSLDTLPETTMLLDCVSIAANEPVFITVPTIVILAPDDPAESIARAPATLMLPVAATKTTSLAPIGRVEILLFVIMWSVTGISKKSNDFVDIRYCVSVNKPDA